MFDRIRLPRPAAGTVLGTLAVVAATGGLAVAAIPGGDGAVTACMAKDGTIRVIDAGAGRTCTASQATLRLAGVDATGRVADADRVDGRDSSSFAAVDAAGRVANADKLDGKDSSAFAGSDTVATAPSGAKLFAQVIRQEHGSAGGEGLAVPGHDTVMTFGCGGAPGEPHLIPYNRTATPITYATSVGGAGPQVTTLAPERAEPVQSSGPLHATSRMLFGTGDTATVDFSAWYDAEARVCVISAQGTLVEG